MFYFIRSNNHYISPESWLSAEWRWSKRHYAPWSYQSFGGKQYSVTEGSEIFVEKLNANAGDVVKFDQVLMLDSKIGSPYLTNVTVEGKVIKNGKQKKITVFKYKSKDRSNRKKQGHRQPYTKIQITKING